MFAVQPHLYRFSTENLRQWIMQKNRKPLLLRGARQVGKSTLVRHFAQDQKRDIVEVNLEKHAELSGVFKTLHIPQMIRELELISGKKISDNKILFLDEIQAAPWAIAALRYFYEERPNLPVIAAGSLLEFAMSEGSFPMPVGRVQYHYLGPLCFEEFIQALGEIELLKELHEYTLGGSFLLTAHKKLLQILRDFMIVGGMPEAVSAFVQGQNQKEIQLIQNTLLLTYRDDFSKYATKKEIARLHEIFSRVPGQIGKKIKYSSLCPDEKSREVRVALDLLTQSKVINKIFHTHCNGIPLEAEAQLDTFKLIFLDVGLLNRALGLNVDFKKQNEAVFAKWIHEGPIAEQFIGQHLQYLNGPNEESRLFYWLREQKAGNAEVDYVISNHSQIIPIEVKSGKSGSLRSLHQFMNTKKERFALRFDINLPSLNQITTGHSPFELLSLPLYLIGQIVRLTSGSKPTIEAA